MPLLRRQPFVPLTPPPGLQPDDEVFFCPLTKEIFLDFESFFERTILCNSLVWSCSITGKSNLTYQEAVLSEQRAIQTVSDIPFELKQPLLFIASLTRRGKVNDACDDVYYFMKDRYFVSEGVEAIIKGKWYPAKVLKVVPPSISEIEQYKTEEDDELSTEDKLVMLNQYGPPPELLKYEVEEESTNNQKSSIHVVTVDCIRREKGLYSRDKVRMYLRNCMQFEEDQGVWIVKPEAWTKLKMNSLTYASIFTGSPPTFEESRMIKKGARSSLLSRNGETSPKTTPMKSTTPKKSVEPTSLTKSGVKHSKLNAEALAQEFIKIREERETLRQLADRRKQQKIDEKQLAKEKKKEEKRAMAEYVKEWSRPRDDLECDDLQDLPLATPVHCTIPNGLFGDFLMLLEFLHCFGDELQLKDAFPGGVSFELLERAVVEKEVSGPLSDILQVLLAAIFELQEAEAEEVKEALSGVTDGDMTEAGPSNQGIPLNKLSMDALTVSEILRLHLVSSGGGSSELRSKWRYQQRGGYNSADDPGVQFREEEPHIFHSLATNTVYELPLGDKLKIIKCLCHQILTYVSIRDVLEERCTKLTQMRVELRTLHSNERRMRKEDAVNRAKVRIEVNGNVNGSAELEKLEKEEARRKGEYVKKEMHLQQQIIKLQHKSHLMPLGLDRAYRRFWVFESCPGLFVEDDDDFVGQCLPEATPHAAKSPSNEVKNKEDIRNFFKAANKENEKVMEKPKVSGLCTADPNNCPVHATYISRTKWAFYENPETLDNLILTLNERGFREGALKNVLLQEKDRIVENIQKCPVHRLDTNKPEVVQASEVRKSSRQIKKEKEYDTNLNFPPGTPIEHIMEQTLVDIILETEEKIFVGGLGALKVKDRNAWRQAVGEGHYEPQSDALIWGGKMEAKRRVKTEENEVEEDDSTSERSSSADGETAGNIMTKKNVADLASALLQLAQSVEAKYLKKPLGEDEKERKRRLKAEESLKKWEDHKESSDTSRTAPKLVRTSLENWELSLRACTSFSQLYVHFSLLDNSITWNRSALNARCRICRRRGDAEKMLLCDGCDKGHHMYCLRPPLTQIPEGDWFCYECKPREKPRTPRKARRVFSEESDDEEEQQVEEEEEEEVVDGEAAEESEVESVHHEFCPVCQEGGHVICCDTCPAVYHLECVNPPLKKVPRGKWSCPQCKIPPAEKERTKLREKNSDGRSSARATRARQVLDFDAQGHDEVQKPATRQRTQTDPIKTKSSPVLVLGKRRSAAEAVDKIAQAAKRLRGESYEDDEGSNSTNLPRRRNRPLPVPSSTSESGVVDMADLEQLLADLMKHPDSWPFLKPVTRAEAPDYHQVIKQAMDLGTMKYKLNTLQYKSTEEFVQDLQLIFTNCYTYNHENADEYKCGRNLNEYVERRLKKLGLKTIVESD